MDQRRKNRLALFWFIVVPWSLAAFGIWLTWPTAAVIFDDTGEFLAKWLGLAK